MANASAADPPDAMWIIDDTPMLVTPIPGEQPAVRQQRLELTGERVLDRIRPGEQLVMREKDHAAIAGLLDESGKPRDLVVGERRLLIGAVETDEKPFGVLKDKTTRRLAELF